ncbi:MAG: site-specific DNA-methyltransferase [Methanomicrobiales archaeon]|nr:site-specific DNA-methyltransferase [Methanomicrobiales archaeon]
MSEPIVLQQGVLYNEDCVTGAARHIPDGAVDLIVTDPPYGIEGDRLHRHYNRNEDYVTGGYVEIPWEDYGKFCTRWIDVAERVLRPGGSFYIVSGYTNLSYILDALRSTRLREVNHLIWKYSFGVFTRKKYVSSHYHILFYEKPGGERTFHTEARYGLQEKTPNGRSLNNLDREDVWIINREYKPARPKNKNELPLGLLTKILQYSSSEGDLVCDFFCGGFSTARAAMGLNRRFVGFEISPEVFTVKGKEIENIEPGYLLPSQRAPAIIRVKNQGKRWTAEDRNRLIRHYTKLRGGGLSRRETVSALAEKLGRGRFAIERALKKYLPEGSP